MLLKARELIIPADRVGAQVVSPDGNGWAARWQAGRVIQQSHLTACHGSAQSASEPLVHCPPTQTHTSRPGTVNDGKLDSQSRRVGSGAQLSTAALTAALTATLSDAEEPLLPASKSLARWQHVGRLHCPFLAAQQMFAPTCFRSLRRLRLRFPPPACVGANRKTNQMSTANFIFPSPSLHCN